MSSLQHLLDQLPRARRAAEVEMQVVDEDQEHATGGVVGRAIGRQDDALLHRRRRRGLHVVDATAVCENERDDVLLDAVFVNLELSGFQVGDELIAALLADDHVGGHEIHADAERWRGRLHWWGLCGGLGRGRRLSRRDGCLSRIPRRRDDCEHADDQTLSEISHGKSILRRV